MSLSGFAGGASDALTEVLKQKFLEMVQRKRLAQDDIRIQEDMRQFDRTAGQTDQRIGLEGQRVGLEGQRVKLDQDQFAEGKRQFDIEQPIRGQLQMAQTDDIRSRPVREMAERDHDLNLTGVRHGQEMQQIGARGAQDRLTIHARPPAASVAKAEQAQTIAEQKQANEVEQLLALMDEMEKDPALPTAVGALDGRGAGMIRDLDGYTRFKNKHDQLVGQLQLAQSGKLKGQGAMSNMERELLKQAASALTRTLSEGDYKGELGKIRQSFKGGKAASPGGGPVIVSVGGRTFTFPNQQAADQFKAQAGIK